MLCYLFFFNDTATTEIYTLSLHDALPIFRLLPLRLPVPLPLLPQPRHLGAAPRPPGDGGGGGGRGGALRLLPRSEEHTSELQSRQYLVCRLLLEKKKYNNIMIASMILHRE